MFTHESEVDHFFSLLNGVHPALKFTVDKEVNGSLPFLDVLVHRTPSLFITSVYSKSTFTGLYTRWNSFCPKRQKINLIRTLTHRALMICSDNTLKDEISCLTGIFVNNGYPLDVVQSVIRDKTARFNKIKPATVGKCPVYLRLPWLGRISESFAK